MNRRAFLSRLGMAAIALPLVKLLPGSVADAGPFRATEYAFFASDGTKISGYNRAPRGLAYIINDRRSSRHSTHCPSIEYVQAGTYSVTVKSVKS